MGLTYIDLDVANPAKLKQRARIAASADDACPVSGSQQA